MDSKPYFDQVAQDWEEMREGFFSRAVREKALSVAQVESGKTAADIGAGTGFVTEGLLEAGLEVIAVDQSEEMLRLLAQRFAGRVDCRCGEAEALPVEDGAVDYVFANMYLHHVERPPVAIREMGRILKLGGKLVITDLDTHDFAFLKEEHHDRWMGFEREDIRQWFVDGGFEDVAVESVGESCEAQSDCGDDFASIRIFVASGRRV